MAWSGGFAEWVDEGKREAYLSIAFTWLLNHAAQRALSYRMLGWRVIAGGPALFLAKMQHELVGLAEIGKDSPDVVARHNPEATIASRGCPGKGTEEAPDPCVHCIVPKMWGTKFTLLPDFPVRPVLCDDNLSALPVDYQDFIVRRYRESSVKLRDANSGFEPVTFTPEVYERWKPLVNAGGGPWRFGYDEMGEREQVLRVMRMLKDEPPKRKRPYVLIGNEPFASCMQRIQECLDHGCEPHVQWVMKLSAHDKEPWVRFDWTPRKLRDVARWANRRGWRYTPFSGYIPNLRSRDRYDAEEGLFV